MPTNPNQEQSEDSVNTTFAWYQYAFGVAFIILSGALVYAAIYFFGAAKWSPCSIDIGTAWRTTGSYLSRSSLAVLALSSFAPKCLDIVRTPCVHYINQKKQDLTSRQDVAQPFKETFNAKANLLTEKLQNDLTRLPERIRVASCIYAILALLATSFGIDQFIGMGSIVFFHPALWLYSTAKSICKSVKRGIRADYETFSNRTLHTLFNQYCNSAPAA